MKGHRIVIAGVAGLVVVVLAALAFEAYIILRAGNGPPSERQQWAMFLQSVEIRVRRESEGKPPSAGETWEEFYNIWIHNLRNGSDNPDDEIEFLLESRRKAGLPDIEVYPPESSDSDETAESR